MSEGVLSVVRSGEESEFEWKLNNFSLSKGLYRSPSFEFEGESWWLELFPNCTDGYIHLLLCRSSRGSPVEVEFSVSVKTTDGIKNFERRKSFKGYGARVIKQWINRREFSNRQGDFLSSGYLTILLTMQKAQCEKETPITRSEAICSCCKERLHEDKITFHKECLNKEAKCSRCDEVVNLQNWFDHACQMENVPSESGVSQPSVSQPIEKTLQDLKNLFFNQENCDLVLRVQGKEFSAHQAILTARSPVFASTFRSNMKEKETGTVDIADIDPSSFPEFLCFLYCGEIDKLSAENVYSLFIAADKYEVPDLRTMCIQFMKENLTVDAFCETLVLALLHTETELVESCADYFIQNAEEIIKSVQWQNFVAENPSQGNELFLKYVQSSKKSNK